jgi:hypothetical protein
MSTSNTSNNISNIDKIILIKSSDQINNNDLNLDDHTNHNENLNYQSLPLPYNNQINKLNNGYFSSNGAYIDVIQEEQQITSNNLIDSINNIQLHNDLNTYMKSNASSFFK